MKGVKQIFILFNLVGIVYSLTITEIVISSILNKEKGVHISGGSQMEPYNVVVFYAEDQYKNTSFTLITETLQVVDITPVTNKLTVSIDVEVITNHTNYIFTPIPSLIPPPGINLGKCPNIDVEPSNTICIEFFANGITTAYPIILRPVETIIQRPSSFNSTLFSNYLTLVGSQYIGFYDNTTISDIYFTIRSVDNPMIFKNINLTFAGMEIPTPPQPTPSINYTQPSPQPTPSINYTQPSPQPTPSINYTQPSLKPTKNVTNSMLTNKIQIIPIIIAVVITIAITGLALYALFAPKSMLHQILARHLRNTRF